MNPTPEPILSRAAIAGHPLHPMMIHFPVAALIGLVAADGGFVYTGDPFWARAGVWLAGVGALGGWGASLAGLVDLLTVGRIRRLITAWGHALIAVMMLSLATLNWMLRLGDDPGALVMPWAWACRCSLPVLSGLPPTWAGGWCTNTRSASTPANKGSRVR